MVRPRRPPPLLFSLPASLLHPLPRSPPAPPRSLPARERATAHSWLSTRAGGGQVSEMAACLTEERGVAFKARLLPPPSRLSNSLERNERARGGELRRGAGGQAGMPERLLAYAKTVGHFPTALKEFEWRNQSRPARRSPRPCPPPTPITGPRADARGVGRFWLDISRGRAAAGKADLTPFHTKLLTKARDDGHVKFD